MSTVDSATHRRRAESGETHRGASWVEPVQGRSESMGSTSPPLNRLSVLKQRDNLRNSGLHLQLRTADPVVRCSPCVTLVAWRFMLEKVLLIVSAKVISQFAVVVKCALSRSARGSQLRDGSQYVLKAVKIARQPTNSKPDRILVRADVMRLSPIFELAQRPREAVLSDAKCRQHRQCSTSSNRRSSLLSFRARPPKKNDAHCDASHRADSAEPVSQIRLFHRAPSFLATMPVRVSMAEKADG